MTRSQHLQAKAALVVVLGSLGLLTAPNGAAAAQTNASFCLPGCWRSCSEAIRFAGCEPEEFPNCSWVPFTCGFECSFVSVCDEI
jgi:hypothetical protein